MKCPDRLLTGGLTLILSGLALPLGCREAREGPTDGETHFLRACQPNTDDCGEGMSCLCGVCTQLCSGSSSCEALLPSAQCVSGAGAESRAACLGLEAASYCDVLCVSDEDCRLLSLAHRCAGGVCRMGEGGSDSLDGGAGGTSGIAPGSGGGGAGGSAGASGGGGAGGVGGADNACPEGDVSANEVLVLGDVFIAYRHEITAYLEDLARQAGALDTGERYRDYSLATDNGFVTGQSVLFDQYVAGQTESPVKVVVMDGGGADILVNSCETAPTPECQLMIDVVAAAESLMDRMAADGVESIVWFSYPNPMDPALLAEMDVLRPLLQAVCESSVVPCYWVDLRATFAGRDEEFMLADGVPTAAGAEAAAREIWSAMELYCVAQ